MNMDMKSAIGVTTCKTAFGWVGIAWSERGLVALTLPQPSEDKALSQLPAGSEAVVPLPMWLGLEVLTEKLRRYFEGQEVTFKVPLDPTVGTEFQRRVWAATRTIPRGKTLTYSDIARLVGSPGAARAVGQAMAHNPWPVIVPCHRVVGFDGSLTGFGGGLDMKQRMLAMEGALQE
jgi:methylated-DNA-[protein]-cysteine S-methyltransferase